MEIKYFEDTDTLIINLNKNQIIETKDLNENIYIDLDSNSNLVSITLEHAKSLTNIKDFSFQQVSAVY